MTLDNTIRKHALKNAFDYGKANLSSVAGRVISESQDAKKDMKTTMKKINETVNQVNTLTRQEIENEMQKYEYIEKPKEEKKGFDIPEAHNGKVITRFPPEPSGYPHIGHAKAGFLDYEVAKQYNGKMILRFDDTNPEKESLEYVGAIKDGLKWLGIPFEKETYTSDNMEKIYTAVEKLLSTEKAYVCTCTQDEISKGRTEMKYCACRRLSKAENEKRWKEMLHGKFDEGTAILRFKGDLSSLNTVMRDPSLARILKTPHYRQKTKYMVWPSYDLAVVVMDANEGITHSMRTKEYELRDELYFALLEILGYKKPQLIEFSRLQIKNAPISKRLLTPLVKEKKVMGWDDPRLPTLKGLERRGILPEAIRTFVLSFGLSKVESEPSWDALLVENRKLVDPVSKHYFFVPDPIKIIVKNAPEKRVELKLLPKSENSGTRNIVVGKEFFVPKKDIETMKKGDVFRLKDLYNVKTVNKHEYEFVGDGMVEKKVQWTIPECIDCEILVPKNLVDDDGNYLEDSLEIVKGVCESACANIREGEIVQFERFGFCRLDKKDNGKLVFIFTC